MKDLVLPLMTRALRRSLRQPFLLRPARRFAALVMLLAVLWPGLVDAAPLPPEDANWDLREENNGIRIYTMDYAGSGFQAFKAETVLNVPVNQVMAVMVTPSSCMQWVHNCVEARQLANGTFQKRFAYSVNDMPWPVTDRDYVLRIETEGHRDTGEVNMHLTAVPDKKNNSGDFVRVEKSDTYYHFEPVGGNKTRMTWIQHTEPNGSIPGWLANTLIVDIPMESLERLKKVVQTDQYQGFKMIYDDNGLLIDVVRPDASGDDGK